MDRLQLILLPKHPKTYFLYDPIRFFPLAPVALSTQLKYAWCSCPSQWHITTRIQPLFFLEYRCAFPLPNKGAVQWQNLPGCFCHCACHHSRFGAAHACPISPLGVGLPLGIGLDHAGTKLGSGAKVAQNLREWPTYYWSCLRPVPWHQLNSQDPEEGWSRDPE